jgi:protein phosphatase
MTEDLAATVRQINQRDDSKLLVTDFLDVWTHAPWWLRVDRMLFVHGAYHPAMLDHDRPEEIAAPRVRAVVKKLALYGEGRQNKDGKLPTRTYGWVDLIPADLTVVVGHDVRSLDVPLVATNQNGGRAVFADTGCGKGGRLACIDIDDETGTGLFRT